MDASRMDTGEEPRKKPFLSAQRRYENKRVTESAIRHWLCYDCGAVIEGSHQYQQHVLTHEVASICQQLYHSEKKALTQRKKLLPKESSSSKLVENRKRPHSED
ncbi:hypothetical protein AAVH_11573 [Aphelenchoides avenae]|nr:hypothetical protein AAVH_11573 [Aphelenchus avenae]